jgi:hypothetical protein
MFIRTLITEVSIDGACAIADTRLKQDALFVNDLLEKIYHNVDVSGHLFNSY